MSKASLSKQAAAVGRKWENPALTNENRLEARCVASSYPDREEALRGGAPSTRLLLNGTWRIATFGSPEEADRAMATPETLLRHTTTTAAFRAL